MIDRAGEQLGNYQLVRLLGRGGFAEVYLGKHIHSNTPVAIKVLQARLTNEDIEKFQNEVSVIGRLKHQHIVQLRDFDIQNGFPFLVMDYAPNGTLRQRHQEGSRLPLPTIVTYLTQIAAALQYAHEQKVIHRDVKPQNMLIGFNDEILLSDFGLAVVSQSTSSPHVQNQAGTLLYMAPEQFDGQARYASDQYALGVIVYEWLCGRSPFTGTSTEIFMQHQLAPPTSLQGKSPYVSPMVEQVVFKALAKDPKQRFHSIQDFALAFKQASQQSQLQFSGIHPVAPSVTPRRRKSLSRLQAAMLIGLLLTLVIGSSGIFYLKVLQQTPAALSFLPVAQTRATSSARAYAAISNDVMFGFDAAHTHVNPYEKVLNHTNVFRLVPYWSASTGNPFFSGSSSPAVVNGIVYIGSGDHKLYAFNAATGKVVWSVSTGSVIDSSPAVVNGIVYIGSDDYKLYAFKASTGKLLWSASTNNTVNSSPAVVNGIVYVGSRDRNLYAFNATTGKAVWSAPTQGPITSSPAVANNIVYIASGSPYGHSGTLYAFNATAGRPLWSTHIDSYIYSSPTIANGVVYIGSNSSYIYAFDAQTGNHLWIAPAGTPLASPAVANGAVYVGSDDNHLYAFHLSSS